MPEGKLLSADRDTTCIRQRGLFVNCSSSTGIKQDATSPKLWRTGKRSLASTRTASRQPSSSFVQTNHRRQYRSARLPRAFVTLMAIAAIGDDFRARSKHRPPANSRAPNCRCQQNHENSFKSGAGMRLFAQHLLCGRQCAMGAIICSTRPRAAATVFMRQRCHHRRHTSVSRHPPQLPCQRPGVRPGGAP